MQPEDSNKGHRSELPIDASSRDRPDSAVSLLTTVAIAVAIAIVTAVLFYILVEFAHGPGGCCSLVIGPFLLPLGSGYASGFLVGWKQGSGRFVAQGILANPVVYLVPYLVYESMTLPAGGGPVAVLRVMPLLVSGVGIAYAGTFIGLLYGGRRFRRPVSAACELCGYNLTGNVSGTCPECGLEISAGQRALLGTSTERNEADTDPGV